MILHYEITNKYVKYRSCIIFVGSFILHLNQIKIRIFVLKTDFPREFNGDDDDEEEVILDSNKLCCIIKRPEN